MLARLRARRARSAMKYVLGTGQAAIPQGDDGAPGEAGQLGAATSLTAQPSTGAEAPLGGDDAGGTRPPQPTTPDLAAVGDGGGADGDTVVAELARTVSKLSSLLGDLAAETTRNSEATPTTMEDIGKAVIKSSELVAAQVATKVGRKVKACSILDQTDETEATAASTSDMYKYSANYAKVKHGPPPSNAMPTPEHMGAMATRGHSTQRCTLRRLRLVHFFSDVERRGS